MKPANTFSALLLIAGVNVLGYACTSSPTQKASALHNSASLYNKRLCAGFEEPTTIAKAEIHLANCLDQYQGIGHPSGPYLDASEKARGLISYAKEKGTISLNGKNRNKLNSYLSLIEFELQDRGNLKGCTACDLIDGET